MPRVDLAGKDLITTQDWSLDELRATLKVARDLKAQYRRGRVPPFFVIRHFSCCFMHPRPGRGLRLKLV